MKFKLGLCQIAGSADKENGISWRDSAMTECAREVKNGQQGGTE